MFGIGTPELIVIAVIALLIFGGKKLPEIGAGLGTALSSFKKGVAEVEDSGRELIDDIPGAKEVAAVKQKVDTLNNLTTRNPFIK